VRTFDDQTAFALALHLEIEPASFHVC